MPLADVRLQRNAATSLRRIAPLHVAAYIHGPGRPCAADRGSGTVKPGARAEEAHRIATSAFRGIAVACVERGVGETSSFLRRHVGAGPQDDLDGVEFAALPGSWRSSTLSACSSRSDGGAPDLHRPAGRREHGAGGKLGRRRGARHGRRTGALRADRSGAHGDLHRRASPSACPITVTGGAGSRTPSRAPTRQQTGG